MIFSPAGELADDPTNKWGPVAACVTEFLHDVGFGRLEFTTHPVHTSRGVFHGYK
jgi:hypothetical protein